MTSPSQAMRMGLRPKVAHVGVERLGAGDGQHDRPEGPEDAEALIGHEVDRRGSD